MNPALLASLPSLLQTGFGIYQAVEGADRLNQPRPQYNMPGETLANRTLAAAEMGSGSRYAENMRAQSDLAAANSITAAVTSGTGSAAVPSILAQQQAASRQASVAAEQKRLSDLATLMGANAAVGAGRDLEFQMNKFAPYMQQYNEGREMVGAGATNIYGGVNGLSSLAQVYMYGQGQPPAQQASNVAATTSRTETDGQFVRSIQGSISDNYDLIKLMGSMYNMQNRPQ